MHPKQPLPPGTALICPHCRMPIESCEIDECTEVAEFEGWFGFKGTILRRQKACKKHIKRARGGGGDKIGNP